MCTIETLATKHIIQCLSISNHLLGVNYHDNTYFENAIQHEQGLVLIFENKIVGFLIFTITPPENGNKMYGLSLHQNVGHIDSVCVASSYQKRGFANELVKKAISILEKEFSTIYTLAWEYRGTINLEKVLVKNKFKKVNLLNSVWKKECENNEFNCPVKENRCICSGIVYRLGFN